MGNIVPIATTALQVFEVATNVAKVFDDSNNQSQSQEQSLQQLQQQQVLALQNARQDAELSKQELQAKAEAVEIARRDALKRAVARQRASYGGNGVASGDGSSEAVLLGLFEQSDEDRKTNETLDKLRLNSIDQNLLQARNINTLQRTQLAERQKLTNSSSTLDDVSKLLSIF